MAGDTSPQNLNRKIAPDIRLALDVLERVGREKPGLAEAWRKNLPVIARRLAQAGGAPDGALLEQIVRENWDAARVKALFRDNAADALRHRPRSYAEIVAAFPRAEAASGETRPERRPDLQPMPLSQAVAAGRLDMVKPLLARGRGSESEAFYAAAGQGRLDIVKYLAGKRYPAQGVKGSGEALDLDYALNEAAKKGHLEVVTYLLEKDGRKADIQAEEDKALRWAARFGHLDVIKYLLGRDGERADIHAGGDEALLDAVRCGHLAIARYLLERDGEKADIHAGDDLALRIATGNADLDMARYLLQKNGERANAGAEDNKALRAACACGDTEVALALLEHGADPGCATPETADELAEIRARLVQWRQVARREPPRGLWRHDPEEINLDALSACRDMLLQENCSASVVNIYAYQAVRLFGDDQQVLRYLKRWGSGGKQPLHDLVHMISCPQRQYAEDAAPRWDRKAWADAVMAQGPKMAKLVKFADRKPPDGSVFLPVRAADGSVSLTLTMEAASNFAYTNSAKNPELSSLCVRHAESEAAFEKGLAIIRETPANLVKDIPDIALPGEVFGMPGARWYRLAPHDLSGLVLGEYTNCCQHLGGVGENCAAHGYKSPHGGFYVLESARGEIIGQSWAWRGTKGELVLDSLETLGARVSQDAWKTLIAGFAAALAEKPGNVAALMVGQGGGTQRALGLEETSNPARPKDYDGYRDSRNQYQAAAFVPASQPEAKRGSAGKSRINAV